jgi:glutathione S-transferase
MPGKLYYFEVEGRAAGIRLMLSHANFQYEDCRQTMPNFMQLKQSGFLPLGSMPVWEEDGFKMCQSSAIMRMLGIRCGYYSEDPMTAWCIDSIVDFCEDKQGAHTALYAPMLGNNPIDEGMADKWFADFWDKVIPVLETRLSGHGKKFIAGTDRPTIADFKAFQTVFMNLESNRGCALSA